ncbi:MAG: DUF5320 domain-containing protein [Deltaproteobacteria bacterium]|nr:DUF5320 domain-containing protein [Deltaproteobacteria bacterium]
MPGFDGTGPMGWGPMTGGGRGFCSPYGMSSGFGYARGPFYGPRFGFGRGGRRGRGFGGRGIGWGFGPGRGRGRGFRSRGFYPAWGW